MHTPRIIGIVLLIAGISLKFVLDAGLGFVAGSLMGAGIALTFFWKPKSSGNS